MKKGWTNQAENPPGSWFERYVLPPFAYLLAVAIVVLFVLVVLSRFGCIQLPGEEPVKKEKR